MELWAGGNATEPIWRVLASSDRISSWTPLKPQHSKTNPNPNLNPLINQLWCINFLTPPHLSSSLTDSMPSLNLLCHLKTDARFMQDGRKAVWSIPYVSGAFFSSLKQNFIAYCSSKVSSCPDCIFKIHLLCQSGFSRVYSNSCYSYSFEPEIIKIGQSSHKMYSNNIVNFQESTTISNVWTKKKKAGNLLNAPRIYILYSCKNITILLWSAISALLLYIYIYRYSCIYICLKISFGLGCFIAYMHIYIYVCVCVLGCVRMCMFMCKRVCFYISMKLKCIVMINFVYVCMLANVCKY